MKHSMRCNRRRDDDGAVAIMVAAMVLVLVSVAAFAVDLGHAFVQKQDVQKVTDFSALAGVAGTNLPGTVGGACSSGYIGDRPAATDQAIIDAAAHLSGVTWATPPTAANLVDCDLANGEAVYGSLTFPSAGTPTLEPDKYKLTVVGPPRTVDFGFAEVMGFSSTTVSGRAVAANGTPGADKVFPSFATDGCDWGQRTIFAPASSSTGPSFTPNLAFSTDKNIVEFDLSMENPSPDSVPVNPAATTLRVTGTNMDTVTEVGFFQEDTGVYKTIPKASFDTQSTTAVTVTVPDDLPAPALTSSAGLWWVRVKAPKTSPSDTTREWSEVKSGTTLKTIPFEVGESYLRCAGVASGTFGDVILPRTDATPSNWTALNMATGLQRVGDQLSLATYPGSPSTVYGASSAPNLCDPADPRTVYSPTSPPDLKLNTNCVSNGTGLTANTATDGLIAGVRNGSTTYPGLLTNSPTTTCAPVGRTVTVNGPSSSLTKTINNDVLTCFMQAGISISTIAAKSYSGGPVLSCEVFDSPRFFYQPVLQVRPGGGSNTYSIVDFRPAFISKQNPAAQKGDGPIDVDNGVTITGGQVTQLDVVFFHPNALPSDCPTAIGPVLGGTTKRAIRLID